MHACALVPRTCNKQTPEQDMVILAYCPQLGSALPTQYITEAVIHRLSPKQATSVIMFGAVSSTVH
eukprot:scaffold94292_cov47-Prasinocladus_malaysianus.AAC.2